MREIPILFSAPMVRALLAGTKTQTRRAIKAPESVTAFRHFDADRWDRMQGAVRGDSVRCPYGQPGDRLWVRESWKWHGGMFDCARERTPDGRSLYADLVVSYPADGARVTLHPNGQDWPTPKQPLPRDGEPYSLRDIDPEDYTGQQTYTDRLQRWWNRTIPGIHMPRWASRITLEVTGVRVERLQDISEWDAKAEGVTPNDGYAGPDEDRCKGWRKAYRGLWNELNGSDAWAANPLVWAIEFKRVAS